MSFANDYSDLIAEYRQSLVETHRDVLRLARQLDAGDDSGMSELRAIAHKLAGNGASFGFPEITTAAKSLTAAALELRERGGSAAAVGEAAAVLAHVCSRAAASSRG